jgi:4-amino-4-deoxy-L-arabinose transferase-like glycosyltransferase
VNLNESRRVFLLLALYFVLQLVARLLVSPGLELDEAEQLVLTQKMQWGYGSQPPLYTWLLGGVFQLFGVRIFSLALMKNLLLFFTYFFTYRSARELGYGKNASIAAMLSLFFIPQIVWESQRDLTHSVLATTLAAVTIYCWLSLKKRPSAVGYGIMGLVGGLGLLAKYNYGIFFVSLLVASAATKEYRALLVKKYMFYTLLVMSVVVAPHAIWMIDNSKTLLKQSHKFKQSAVLSFNQTIVTGISDIVMASLKFALPLLLVYSVIYAWQRHHRQEVPGSSDENIRSKLLIRSVAVSLLLCVAMVLLFRVTVFKDRWMQPILFFLPLALLPWMGSSLDTGGGRFIRGAAFFIGSIVLLLMAGRPFISAYMGKVSRFNLPYSELAAQLERQVSLVDLVLADNRLLGGNLRLHYPWKRVDVPEVLLFQDIPARTVLVVRNESEGTGPRRDAAPLVEGLLGSGSNRVEGGEVAAPMRFLPDRIMRLSHATYVRAAQ